MGGHASKESCKCTAEECSEKTCTDSSDNKKPKSKSMGGKKKTTPAKPPQSDNLSLVNPIASTMGSKLYAKPPDMSKSVEKQILTDSSKDSTRVCDRPNCCTEHANTEEESEQNVAPDDRSTSVMPANSACSEGSSTTGTTTPDKNAPAPKTAVKSTDNQQKENSNSKSGSSSAGGTATNAKSNDSK